MKKMGDKMKTVKKLICTLLLLCMTLLLSVPVMAGTKKPSKPAITAAGSTAYGSGTVSFSKAARAKGYQVQFALNTRFTSGRKTVTTSGTSVTRSGLTPGKTYYVRVRAYNKNGRKTQYGSWSGRKSFTVKNVDKPGTPSISSLVSTNASRGTVNYTAADKATKYEVQFALNSRFSSGLKKVITTGKSVTRTDLGKGKVYYVRVRSYNQSRPGDWSAAKTFKVETKYYTNVTQAQWLQTVKSWCDYMIKDGDWIYANSNNRKNIDLAIKQSHTTNCALMVTHALQKIGVLTKGNYFYSNDKGEPQGAAGWKEICKYADVFYVNRKRATELNLQPGDIVMWDTHVNVYIGKNEKGLMTWYDASSLLTVDKKPGSVFKNFYRVDSNLNSSSGKPHVAYKVIRLHYKK